MLINQHVRLVRPLYLFLDQKAHILAITDSVQVYGGGHYGYVRFYNLKGDPAKPVYKGQERLAEAWSGIPGRVVLQNGYAYVSTAMAGVHIVNIEKAEDYDSQMPGGAIEGVYNTISEGFGQPGDLATYDSDRLILTTSKGHLLVLDISLPYYPRLVGSVTPVDGGYNAFRAAATSAYTFEDDSGMSHVIDLVVTGSRTGGINTIDVTDPYNPQVIGTVKDENGNDVLIFSSDIAISKNAGLVFIASGASVYVVDVKDPYNPILLNVINQAPVGADGVLDELLGYSAALVEKQGWVYLANQNQGLRILGSEPEFLWQDCSEKEFSTSLDCNDYYPVLARNGVGKTIILVGKDLDGAVLNSPAKIKLINVPDSVSVTSDGGSNVCATGSACEATFNNGIARFHVKASNNLNANDTPLLKLDFEIALNSLPVLSLIKNLNGSIKTIVRLKVRDSSNVTFGEVLKGGAVFIADKRKGKTEPTAEHVENRKVAFLQELLNQVVPRKRSVKDYNLLDEDGYYGTKSSDAIELFKAEFNVGVNTIATGTNNNLSDIFKKLMKDYNLSSSAAEYLNKIVDKETLVGTTENSYRLNSSIKDNLINDPPPKLPSKITGLYELYNNVVERFSNDMVDEMKRYTSNEVANNWVSRGKTVSSGYGPATCNSNDQTQPIECAGQHGNGMSYCFGCKQNISEFNFSVSTYKAPPNGVYGNITSIYRGNIDDTDGNIDSATATVDGDEKGTRNWPGLYDDEWDQWVANGLTANDPYYPKYWAGIDCIGLVLRGLQASAATAQTAGKALSFPEVCINDGCTTKASLSEESTLSWVGTSKFNNEMADSAYHAMKSNDKETKLIKKGDVVLYKKHISTVYSPNAYCDDKGKNCTYEIIHAYGRERADLDGNKTFDFARKVVISNNEVLLPSGKKSLSSPNGFGRIKLWD